MGWTYSQMMYAACAGTFFGGFVALAAASIILKRVIQRRAITIAEHDLMEMKPRKRHKAIPRLLDVFAAIAMLIFLLLPASFDHVPWWASGIFCAVFLIIWWGIKSSYFLHFLIGIRCMEPAQHLYADMEEDQGYAMVVTEGPFAKRNFEPKQKLLRHTLRQGIPILVFCIVLFGMSWSFSSICVAFEPLEINVRLGRFFQGDPCYTENGSPCHVYVMVGRDASHEMIVHWHSYRKYNNPILMYDDTARGAKNASAYRFIAPAREYYFKEIEFPRYIYYAVMSNLTGDSNYFFTIGDDSGITSPTERRVLTAPVAGSLEEEFTIVTGGDLGMTKTSEKMVSLAMAEQPIALSIGGDLSYDNGMRSCYRRWDTWLSMIETKLTSSAGRIIPLITAIGNHEVGGFNQNSDKFTFYKTYFVQEPFDTDKTPNDLKTYNTRQIGNTVLVSLDSAIVTAPGGDQATWLDEKLAAAKADGKTVWKTALYHVPMWPSVRELTDPVVASARAAWLDIFDKHGLDIGLENHDHAYKRTKLIKNRQVVETGGTLYLGDGSMGVEARPAKTGRDYLDVTAQDSFFFSLRFNATAMVGRAIGADGKLFDSFVIWKV